LSEAAGALEETAAAYDGAPGFIEEGGALADGPPPGLRGGLGAIAKAPRMWKVENEQAQVVEGEETRREEFLRGSLRVSATVTWGVLEVA
jgi:hypothetical protein